MVQSFKLKFKFFGVKSFYGLGFTFLDLKLKARRFRVLGLEVF